LDAICETFEGIEAGSAKELRKFMAEAQKSGLIDNVRGDLLLQEAMEFLKDKAVVEETDPEPEKCDVHGH
jgi:trigger factor